MTIKENMLSILTFIATEGAIHLIVVAIFTEIFPEAAMPCQKLCHVKINMTVSPCLKANVELVYPYNCCIVPKLDSN